MNVLNYYFKRTYTECSLPFSQLGLVGVIKQFEIHFCIRIISTLGTEENIWQIIFLDSQLLYKNNGVS